MSTRRFHNMSSDFSVYQALAEEVETPERKKEYLEAQIVRTERQIERLQSSLGQMMLSLKAYAN